MPFALATCTFYVEIISPLATTFWLRRRHFLVQSCIVVKDKKGCVFFSGLFWLFCRRKSTQLSNTKPFFSTCRTKLPGHEHLAEFVWHCQKNFAIIEIFYHCQNLSFIRINQYLRQVFLQKTHPDLTQIRCYVGPW